MKDLIEVARHGMHFYYRNSSIACGLSIDFLPSEQLTCTRAEATCTACLEQIARDRLMCPACRGEDHRHTCASGADAAPIDSGN